MIKILVIEDEVPLQEEILELLRLEGFEAIGAATGNIGVKLAKQHLPDLILCDITMPLLDGYGVLLKLRNDPATATIPFIFLTAKANRKDMRRGMEFGADDYLTKPFTSAELLLAIHVRLAKREALASMYGQGLAPVSEQSVAELIGLGESATLGFQRALQWDAEQNQVSRDLHLSVLKTIAAFLNSNGGTLIIGVDSDGTVYGLQHDLGTLGDRSLGAFEQTLMSLIHKHIGVKFVPFIKIHFEEVEGCPVCAVGVDRASEPVFIQTRHGREFFVRMGNITRAFDPQEAVSYVRTNWE